MISTLCRALLRQRNRADQPPYATGDAAIVAGLKRWRDATRAYMAHPGDGECPEWLDLFERADVVRRDVMALPAKGVEGVAIKSYLAMQRELGCDRGGFGLDYDGGLMSDDGTARQLIADAVRLSPTLARLFDEQATTSDGARASTDKIHTTV